MKQVGVVTAKQFGYLYIQGVPYSPAKVMRFMNKGVGIKLQDLVIFDFDMIDTERVLNYCKNALYGTAEENKMVREFVKASELAKSKMNSDQLSDQIKKDLAEEGLIITNEGTIVNQMKDEMKEPEFPECPIEIEEPMIDPEILKVLDRDARKQLAIILQSQLRNAIDVVCPETPAQIARAKDLALELTAWIDDNSTRMLSGAREYLKKP